MDKDLQSRLEELVKEYENEQQIMDMINFEAENYITKYNAGEVDIKEAIKISRALIDQTVKLNIIQSQLFDISNHNKILPINNQVLRAKLKRIIPEVYEQFKKNEYERWDAHGPLSDEDWESWFYEISTRIYDRPWSDSLYDLINKISPKEYTERGYEIIALVLNQDIPKEFLTLFSDIDLSYRFGLFNSVLVCCRSVIEIGIKNYHEENKYQKYYEAKENKEVNLEWLIDSLEESIGLKNRDKEKAHFVRIKANSILHSGAAASQEEAFKAIKNTHYILKNLYGTDNSDE